MEREQAAPDRRSVRGVGQEVRAPLMDRTSTRPEPRVPAPATDRTSGRHTQKTDDGEGGVLKTRRVTRTTLLAIASAAALGCAACSGSGESAADQANRRLWGRDSITAAAEQRAKEAIDPYVLDTDPVLRQRVLSMDFEELVQRLGHLEYKGVARFDLSAGEQKLGVVEDTTIQHGLHGSFRVLQLDGDGQLTRETIYNNGVFYVRNGGGEMRVQGIIKDQHLTIRDEAWQPLRVYTRYFGERLALTKVGSATTDGRNAARYKLGLGPGAELITVPDIEGAKKPLELSGELFLDEATGAPIKCKLEGLLEIPADKGKALGRLRVSLDFVVKTVPGEELKPKKFIPTIRRHPVDLAPLAFLDGGTRTSTIIGGKRPPARPPEDLAPAAPARTSTAGGKAPKKKKP